MSETKHTILYIHGMGGGADSRIPSIIREYFSNIPEVEIICRTYDFDPEIAHQHIESLVSAYSPFLVIGESLGSLHALRIYGLPVLLVSPALNTPFFFKLLSWLVWIPGMKSLFERIYKPREGDRQKMNFTREVLAKYSLHGKEALEFRNNSSSELHAFFGVYDHYRRSGVVSIRKWRKLFGESFTVYQGTHFMEEEFIHELLIPKINSLLATLL